MSGRASLAPDRLGALDTDVQWANRDPNNRMFCTATDAAFRLRGLADVLRSVGLSVTMSKNNLHLFSFLADTASDVAHALDRSIADVRKAMDEDDEKAAKEERKQKRAGRKSR